ncbi:protein-disulfide reductase DsbD [Acuticoccus sp. M5D2P5]|uniref:protein-disulfide reductase DsbD n=1 Tax=Acuticoccus kalidii TaxID=2910977 RepID=UPI001F38C598|nr:protein-disulfide reductase DsbD [Acuticoccus kalidii]
MKRTIAAIALALATCGAAAQVVTSALPVDAAFKPRLHRADGGGVRIAFRIAESYYLYRDHFAAKAGEVALKVETPAGDMKDDPTFGRTEIFHDAVDAVITAPALAGLPDGARVTLTYQGCQDGGICYRPATLTFDPRTLEIAAPPAGGTAPSFGAFAPASGAGSVPAGASGIVADAGAGGLVPGLLADGGRAMVVATFFVLGLGLAFTPCVFPMYPILAGQLTGRGAFSLGKSLAHSLAYVGAMAAAFGLVGLVAAWSGANLQAALQSRLAIGAIAALFAALALSMFGAFALRLPARWVNRISGRQSGSGLGGSAALGFSSALIVGPCVTVPLAGALVYIAQTGDAALGAGALFALGIGQGVPLVIFGTVGARFMPRAGGWMAAVTRAFGVVFLALAIAMLSRIVPASVTMWLAAFLATGIGVALVGIGLDRTGWPRQIAGTLGVVALVGGAAMVTGALAGASDPLRPLAPLTASRTATESDGVRFVAARSAADVAAVTADGPTLLYFTADWCVSCDIIEARVFGNPEVAAALAEHPIVAVDVTEANPATSALMAELGVAGPPTMIFVRQGVERPGSRLVGEFGPDAFLAGLREAGL